MKKLAILLRGQSHSTFYSHKIKKTVNYNNYINKFNELIKLYKTSFEVDIFLQTFESEILDKEDLLNKYKPVDYKIIKNICDPNEKTQSEIGKNIYQAVKCVIETFFNYCNKKNTTYDMVIIMRYDIIINKNIDINILDPNKYNLHGIFYKYNRIYSDDNILVTSQELLKKYYNALLKIENTKIGNLHFMVQYLEKELLFDLNIYL